MQRSKYQLAGISKAPWDGTRHWPGATGRIGSGQEGTDVKRMLEGIGGGAEEQVCVWGVGRVAQKAKPDGIHSFENIQ